MAEKTVVQTLKASFPPRTLNAHCGYKGGKQMKKGMAYFLGLLLLFGCATVEQRQQATEGITFETNKPRDKAIDAIVQILTEEGYSIDTINEKYGIINCKPYKILSGELMKKLGEPGGGFVATNQHLIHYIEFSAVISEQGTIKLKATASSEEAENIFTMMANPQYARRSMALDVFRTEKLQNYFAQKIKERVSK